jgi:hypothetical protein
VALVAALETRQPAGGGDDAKARTGAVSHRQQAMRIANNMRVLALVRPQAVRSRAVFRISIPKCRLDRGPDRHWQHLAGNLRARTSDGIDLPTSRVACVD